MSKASAEGVIATNVISYLMSGGPLAQAYEPYILGHTMVIAFQTVAELRFGAYRARWGERRIGALEEYLKSFAVVFPDDATCERWGRLRTEAERKGRHIDASDAWIAATALELNIPLITHNRKDFEMLEGLTLLSRG